MQEPWNNREKNRAIKRKRAKIGVLIFRIISLIIIIICVRVLIIWNKENKENGKVLSELQNDNNIKEETIDVSNVENGNGDGTGTENSSDDEVKLVSTDFEELLAQNKDTVAWIYIANTNINFPVVQAKDNKFYLKKNFKKEYNSAGWIFADYRNSFENLDQNTIVYGHNRRNGTMFSNLKKFLDASFAQKPSSMYFSFNTPKQRYIAKIYSVYKISSTKLTLANNFENSEEYQKFIDEVKSRSQYEYTTEVYTSDKTLTLCTCDDNTAYRIAIHAKLIPIDNENDDNSNESNEAEDEDNDNTDNNNNNQ